MLVPVDEQIKRVNAARFQLDIMRVPGLIVARTDAEAASLIDGRNDERDHPFLLGATADVPSYKVGYLTLLRCLHEAGLEEVSGHLLYALAEKDVARARVWLDQVGILAWVMERVEEHLSRPSGSIDDVVDEVTTRFVATWETEACLATYGEAVAEALEVHASEGEDVRMTPDEWRSFAAHASLSQARAQAVELGVDIEWGCERAVTPEGYYQVRGGIAYAIARSLAVAPFSDLLWMETKTANLDDARGFAEAIHAEFPDKMLAYNPYGARKRPRRVNPRDNVGAGRV